MSFSNLTVSIFVILGMLIIYDKISKHDRLVSESKQYKQYLVNQDGVENIDIKKPILWVHVTNHQNARWWQSFYSRNSEYLNQPYLFLTIQSIISKNREDFNIALIDDDSFSKIIPGWSHDVSKMADPIRTHMRTIALTKLLSLYGGLLVPNSFACSRPLIDLFHDGLADKDMFVCEDIPSSVVSNTNIYYPNIRFMGCVTKSPTMMKLNNYVVNTVSGNYTDEISFSGVITKYCHQLAINREINIISGSKIGIKKQDNTPVELDDLFNSKVIELDPASFGLYVPEDRILQRIKYGYFPRMSVKQVLESQIFVGKFISSTYSI